MTISFTDENFAEYFNDEKLIVIDFFASWCTPCKKVGPIMERVAKKVGTVAYIGTCNVDDNDELVKKFSIRNIPAILFVKGKKIQAKIIGTTNEEELTQKIYSLLNTKTNV